MKKYLLALLLVPFISLAADSVSISDITVKGYTATVNGSSVYDTSTQTDVSFDSDSANSTTDTSWSFSQSLKPGTHSVQATVGSASASQSFDIHSNEGGLRACQLDGSCPNFGFSAPEIPTQNPTTSVINNRAKDGTLVTIQNLFLLLSAGLI